MFTFTPRPSSKLLLRRKRLTQLFGQRSEDKICKIGAGDVVRTVRHSRHVGRAVTNGDVTIDLDHHRGVELGMLVDTGVVTG